MKKKLKNLDIFICMKNNNNKSLRIYLAALGSLKLTVNDTRTVNLQSKLAPNSAKS